MATADANTVTVPAGELATERLDKDQVAEVPSVIENKKGVKKEGDVNEKQDLQSNGADLEQEEFEDKNAHVEIKQDSQSKEADLEQAATQEEGEVQVTQKPVDDSKAETKTQESQDDPEPKVQTEQAPTAPPSVKAAVVEPVQTRQAAEKLKTSGGKRKAKAVEDESAKKACLIVEP